MPISQRDLGWAAGFLEGEGCFGFWTHCLRVQAVQVQREPLERLLSLFGGSIYPVNATQSGNRQPKDQYALTGARAAGLMMALYPIMSPKRRAEIVAALTEWRTLPLHSRIAREAHGSAAWFAKHTRRGKASIRYRLRRQASRLPVEAYLKVVNGYLN